MQTIAYLDPSSRQLQTTDPPPVLVTQASLANINRPTHNNFNIANVDFTQPNAQKRPSMHTSIPSSAQAQPALSQTRES